MAMPVPTSKFWMVYGIDQGAPTRRHDSAFDAGEEAKRLARICPGKIFVVLEAIGAVVKDDLKTTLLHDHDTVSTNPFVRPDEEIPF